MSPFPLQYFLYYKYVKDQLIQCGNLNMLNKVLSYNQILVQRMDEDLLISEISYNINIEFSSSKR